MWNEIDNLCVQINCRLKIKILSLFWSITTCRQYGGDDHCSYPRQRVCTRRRGIWACLCCCYHHCRSRTCMRDSCPEMQPKSLVFVSLTTPSKSLCCNSMASSLQQPEWPSIHHYHGIQCRNIWIHPFVWFCHKLVHNVYSTQWHKHFGRSKTWMAFTRCCWSPWPCCTLSQLHYARDQLTANIAIIPSTVSQYITFGLQILLQTLKTSLKPRYTGQTRLPSSKSYQILSHNTIPDLWVHLEALMDSNCQYKPPMMMTLKMPHSMAGFQNISSAQW